MTEHHGFTMDRSSKFGFRATGSVRSNIRFFRENENFETLVARVYRAIYRTIM
jgi:hypothetical protein